MLTFGGMTLVANLACLALLWRFHTVNLNMLSTFECARNIALSNIGVLLVARLVSMTGPPGPSYLPPGCFSDSVPA